ncbi:MAG: hypothetical protein KDE27_01215 [Planctomycetes bacterium]|nr:hypothetical protein [Planctomycetota bacterium]
MKSVLSGLLFAAGIVAQGQVSTASGEVPSAGVRWEVVKPLKPSDVHVLELLFQGKLRRPDARGSCGAFDGHAGSYSDQLSEASALGFDLTCPRAELVLGAVALGGGVSADIQSGVGNAAVGAKGTSKVVYCGAESIATGKVGIALASQGAPIGVGGNIQLFGFGAGFSVSVTPDRPTAASQSLNEADSDGWRLGTSATVTITTSVDGAIDLIVGPSGADCRGFMEANAEGGAYVVFARIPPS